MDVYLNQLRRIIDRIILPQFPELKSYTFDVRETNDWTYIAVVYVPRNIKMYNDWENQEEDKWKNIATQTKRYYDATGHDEHYILGAVGEVKRPVGVPEPGTRPPIKWWWKLDSEQDWRYRRDRTAQFYADRRNQNR